MQATRKEEVQGGPSAGRNDAPNKDEQPPTSTFLICAHCGHRSDKLKRCSRCKCTYYCSPEHQRADYWDHKYACKFIVASAAVAATRPTDIGHPHIWANRTFCLRTRDKMPKESPAISWRELEGMHPYIAVGRTLEVYVVSEPTGILTDKTFCDGIDAEGCVRGVQLMTFRPPDLRRGCIVRWRNPWFHHFATGGSGANIEDWDLPNVTVSAV